MTHVRARQTSSWPATIELFPSQFPAVPPEVLRSWITKHKPIICGMRAELRTNNPAGNQAKYDQLYQELENQRRVRARPLPCL
jgi:hypothetical protein